MTDDILQDDPQVETETTPKPDGERTFTQAELNKLIKERLDRERGKFADYEDLKAKAARFDEAEAEKLSELDKANKMIADLKAERDKAEASRLASERRANIVSAATRLNFADPEDAVAFVGNAEDIEVALGELSEQKPYLLKQDKKQRPKLDPSSPGPVEKTETRSEKKARIMGLGGLDVFDPAGAAKHGGGLVIPLKDENLEEKL